MNHVGRKSQGALLVEPLSGSSHAKQRMEFFLKTMADECTVEFACDQLGICRSRFFALRTEWLQGALGLLEPRTPGRPSKIEPPVSASELKVLRQRLQQLEARAAAVEVQSELVRTMPRVLHRCHSPKKASAPAMRRSGQAPTG